jgi:FkbM family methyltransferase
MRQFSLTQVIPDIPTVNIVDIGAMSLGAGTESYAPLLRLDKAKVIGFEPDQEECEKLRGLHSGTHEFYPHFIGDGGAATYHETSHTMTGSLYPPNTKLLQKFQNLHELTVLQKKHPVETRRLDDIEEIADVDYIKIDVQGAELDVFRGATKSLAKATLIQTEVEFVEMYEGQPLFGDVDRLLRGAGFQFHTFEGFGKRCFKPLVANNDLNRGLRQILWSDAVYVRDFMEFESVQEDKLLKLALVLHDLFHSCDLCLYILTEIDRRAGTDHVQSYREAFADNTPA